jgi:hypothetical protein
MAEGQTLPPVWVIPTDPVGSLPQHLGGADCGYSFSIGGGDPGLGRGELPIQLGEPVWPDPAPNEGVVAVLVDEPAVVDRVVSLYPSRPLYAVCTGCSAEDPDGLGGRQKAASGRSEWRVWPEGCAARGRQHVCDLCEVIN